MDSAFSLGRKQKQSQSQSRHCRKGQNHLSSNNGRKSSTGSGRDAKDGASSSSSSSSCPRLMMSSMVRGIGRCVFVTCYPVIRCFGLDEHRHRRHHHHHKHFF
ncbi:hypothetical protein PanWU01x14_340010 [Parasponia andersonii]|uniref:Uncharacterized protein n=1 Tax=Parasponia andersonii TaxID=3476 RepID=A0A2P5AEH5_PARAD|nr:hypothetical protein PanWU01x14_340010 [Parasponia andersonii]